MKTCQAGNSCKAPATWVRVYPQEGGRLSYGLCDHHKAGFTGRFVHVDSDEYKALAVLEALRDERGPRQGSFYAGWPAGDRMFAQRKFSD